MVIPAGSDPLAGLPVHQSDRYAILTGDAGSMLAHIPDRSVQTIVTSPPYYGHRGYDCPDTLFDADPACRHTFPETAPASAPASQLTKGMRARPVPASGHIGKTAGARCTTCGAWRGLLGLEPAPADYVRHLTAILSEAQRVLRDDGTLWLNLGDTYAAVPYAPWSIQPQDLMDLPHRVVHALQAAGWHYRAEEIWCKASPMPEDRRNKRSVRAHEYLFLLTKHPGAYYYDVAGAAKPNAQFAGTANTRGWTGVRAEQRLSSLTLEHGVQNRRSWFVLNPDPEPAGTDSAHPAVFPRALVELCLLRSTPAAGCCARCGAPYERQIEPGRSLADVRHAFNAASVKSGQDRRGAITPGRVVDRMRQQFPDRDHGWAPSCTCAAGIVPATVLDPFSGSGRTGQVALAMGRRYLGIELNPAYAAASAARLEAQ